MIAVMRELLREFVVALMKDQMAMQPQEGSPGQRGIYPAIPERWAQKLRIKKM